MYGIYKVGVEVGVGVGWGVGWVGVRVGVRVGVGGDLVTWINFNPSIDKSLHA